MLGWDNGVDMVLIVTGPHYSLFIPHLPLPTARRATFARTFTRFCPLALRFRANPVLQLPLHLVVHHTTPVQAFTPHYLPAPRYAPRFRCPHTHLPLFGCFHYTLHTLPRFCSPHHRAAPGTVYHTSSVYYSRSGGCTTRIHCARIPSPITVVLPTWVCRTCWILFPAFTYAPGFTQPRPPPPHTPPPCPCSLPHPAHPGHHPPHCPRLPRHVTPTCWDYSVPGSCLGSAFYLHPFTTVVNPSHI